MYNYITPFTHLGSVVPNKISKKYAQAENDKEYMNTVMLLLNLSLKTFKYNNLDENCDARMLEINNIYRGKCQIYRDKDDFLWSYGASIAGELTRYGYPDKGRYYALNGIEGPCEYYWPFKDNSKANAVMCLDNPMMYPFYNYIDRMARTISDAKRAVETAANNSKFTYILRCDPEQKNSMITQMEDVQNNNLLVVTTKENDFTNQVDTLPTNAKSGSVKELWDYYIDSYNAAKDILGIRSNKQSDKRERLLTTEVSSDDEFIKRILNMRLEERQAFCDRCNKYLGTNMSVEVNKCDNVILANDNIILGGNDNEDNETI